ncbi:MAG: hypothetical protein VX777_08265 [Chlamydiota bacterium]|nr:hypothetical protein [Chlamydiota bacterium]
MMTASPLGNYSNTLQISSPSSTWKDSASSFLSTIWTQTSSPVETLDEINYCSIEQLREKSIVLNPIIEKADSAKNDAEKSLDEINKKITFAKQTVMQKHSIACDKLRDLYTSTYNLKYSIFTELPEERDIAFEHSDSLNRLQGDPREQTPFEALEREVDELTSLPSTNENIAKVDHKMRQLLEMSNRLALKKLSMSKDVEEKYLLQQDYVQNERDVIKYSFDRRNHQYESIHGALLKTKDKVLPLLVTPPFSPPEPSSPETDSGYWKDYVSPVINYLSGQPYKTGFESHPNTMFHQLCSNYLTATEDADKAFSFYETKLKEGFDVYKQLETAQQNVSKLKEQKRKIQEIIYQKMQLMQIHDSEC